MATITGTAGDDVINGTTGFDSIDGGAGNDTITGGGATDTIYGGSGNDVIYGSDGGGIMMGEGGDDYLSGGTGNDAYYGVSGIDTIVDAGGSHDGLYFDYTITSGPKAGHYTTPLAVNIDLATDTSFALAAGATVNWTLGDIEDLYGSNGNDSLTGDSDANILNGNAGNDTIIGADGNDTIYGGGGNDSLDGGNGDDTYMILNTAGLDTITDASGTDTLNFSQYTTAAVSLNLGSSSSFVQSAGNTISWTSGDIENLVGGSLNDTLTGDSNANTLTGGNGNDTLSGADGNDSLDGGNGNDSLVGGNGNDTLDGGVGNDTTAGGAGDDFYFVRQTGDVVTENVGEGTDTVRAVAVAYTMGANIENLEVQANFTETGNSLDNTITVIASGNGTIIDGATGNDTLVNNGNGNVIYQFDNGFGIDTVSSTAGSSAIDTLSFLNYSTNAVNINLATDTSYSDASGNTVTWTLGEMDALGGTALADTLTGDSRNNVLTGNGGNDTLSGGDGNDTLSGGTGNDSLDGGNGDDAYVIQATTGFDTIVASSGFNTLDISAATTAINLNLSSATSYVQSAGNTVTWTLGDIEGLFTGTGNDTLTGDANANILQGGTGNDSLTGGAGADTLMGGDGNDSYLSFSGSFGSDVISDSSGTADVANFSTFATTAATWSAVDTNSDSFVDALFIDFGSGNNVTIANYFNNTSADDDASSAGSGAVESMVFSNDSSVTFSDVLTLVP